MSVDSTLSPPAEPGTEASALGIPRAPSPPTFRDLAAEERIAQTVLAALEPRFERFAEIVMSAREAVREETAAQVRMLDAQHRSDMADADRKWDARVTRLEGHQQALVEVCGNGFSATSREVEKLARLVGSVLTHVVQNGGERIDDAEGSQSDIFEAEASTRSG